ncbi:nitroreductase [Paractinoplanes abujensis]|uniref:Nitroreductase n=1 Tax=Paractinoplanes abujensis TaxID=882441 RepID=A0A7W7CRN8_9ACTN|nr:nitroreductase family protein [Actinoplanes abujensis]MBB4693479.1 nitroreductase [Actinoplanes abujensis]GID21863.1 nitroreductase [Actinoplanes abujensis]
MDSPELVRCIETATLAPSLHNSQPWRFRLTGEEIEVYADHDRQLDVLDPDGRELLVSVGAAVFTLRLALRRAGRIPQLAVLPDPGRPDLVAVIRPGSAAQPSAAVLELADAIERRHTNRQPFLPKVVPADAIEELRAAAGHEGAALTIAGAASRTVIAGLGREAERRLRARDGYRAEMGRWTRPVAHRRDGVPSAAYGPWDALERLPMRDFGLVHAPRQRRSEVFEKWPTIAVLTTGADGPADWIRAGQALQRVLLVATRRHLATTPISQPVEIPGIREVLTDRRAGRFAQMVIRLGYGPPAPATPRRPIAEVLSDRAASHRAGNGGTP